MMPLRVPGLGPHTPNTKAKVNGACGPAFGADAATGGRDAVRRSAPRRLGGSGDGGRRGYCGCTAAEQPMGCTGRTAGASTQDRKAISDAARPMGPLVRLGRAGAPDAHSKQEGAQGNNETSEAADAAAAAAAAAGAGATARDVGAGAGMPISTAAPQAGARPPKPRAAQGPVPRGPHPLW